MSRQGWPSQQGFGTTSPTWSGGLGTSGFGRTQGSTNPWGSLGEIPMNPRQNAMGSSLGWPTANNQFGWGGANLGGGSTTVTGGLGQGGFGIGNQAFGPFGQSMGGQGFGTSGMGSFGPS